MSEADPLWPQALAHYPFAAALLPGWRERAAELPAAYQAALDAALIAFGPEHGLAERYQRLIESRDRLASLAAGGDAHIATQLLRIRVHRACGEPETARHQAQALWQTLETGPAHELDRPFLPSLEAFEQCAPSNPNDALNDWLTALVLDTATELNAAGRHAEPELHLTQLARRRKLPCWRIDSERMLALVALRLGKQVTIKPGGRLATEGLNLGLWLRIAEASREGRAIPNVDQGPDEAVPAPPSAQPQVKPARTQPRSTTPVPAPTAAKQARPSKQRRQARPWQLEAPIRVVDIGANPIDGAPPYAGLLKQGVIELIGFEPQRDALAKLQAMKGPHETYLPHAVGDGGQATLYICQASGMTSTLKPNNSVLDHFQGYPIWGKVKSTAVMDTVRLDDVAEITHIDWLKIDIQGGELTVFKHGERKLKDTLVIQTEANFIQLYEGQPLFADIDQWMRAHGFMLHTLLEQRRRLYAPMTINGGIHQGLNQLTTADAVYIPAFDRLKQLATSDLLKLATIMDEAYQSYDYTLQLLGLIDSRGSRSQKAYAQRYQERLKHIKLTADSPPPPSSPAPKQSTDPGTLLLRHPRSYLHGLGWEQSLRSRESTAKGRPVPWVTYPFLHFLDKRIRKEFKVFEYGSGNSTLWLSAHVEKIVSVEHDAGWYQKMKGKMPANVDYIYHALEYGGAYGQEITKHQYTGLFDIVFVDGRDRVNCLRNCVHALKQDGIVILDNAERPQYNSGSDFLLQQGFKRIDFIGMGPVNLEAWSTAVFYRDGNCLGL